MGSSASLPDALILGALLALAVSVLGFKRRWLTLSGSIAAVPIGAAVFSAGWILISALLFLFLSAAAIARFTRTDAGPNQETAHQHKPRAATQVIAVGIVPALAAAASEFGSCATCVPIALSALAFATADTWATEIGMTSKSPPRLLGFGRRIPSGVSGGMTLRGTLASLGGALAVALVAAPLGMRSLSIVTLGGFAGALVDSLLGTTLQSRFRCVICNQATEDPRHCGAEVARVRYGLSNAGVNLVTSAAIATVTYFVAQ